MSGLDNHLIQSHFNKLLLTSLIVFFGGLAVYFHKYGGTDDAFKFAIAQASAVSGALLMMLRGDKPKQNDSTSVGKVEGGTWLSQNNKQQTQRDTSE